MKLLARQLEEGEVDSPSTDMRLTRASHKPGFFGGDIDHLWKYSPSGQVLAAWGTKGSGPGQFSGPVDCAVDRRARPTSA